MAGKKEYREKFIWSQSLTVVMRSYYDDANVILKLKSSTITIIFPLIWSCDFLLMITSLAIRRKNMQTTNRIFQLLYTCGNLAVYVSLIPIF